MGSCLLIEAESKEGKILIIRGLNPRNDLINNVDTVDFYNKFMEYAHGIAVGMNAELVLALDDHSGGCTTNRPALFETMYSYPKGESVIPLRSNINLQSLMDMTYRINYINISHFLFQLKNLKLILNLVLKLTRRLTI